MISVNYDFSVRMNRDSGDDYTVVMFDLATNREQSITPIEFVFDTGAKYTMLNKDFAEKRGYEKFGNSIVLCGYESIPDSLWQKYLDGLLSAEEQLQFNKLAMICDLRKIPKLTFGLKQITDLVIATPQDGNRAVSNLLGRNFIDTFQHGVDPDNNKIYFKKRSIMINPNYSYGQILHTSSHGFNSAKKDKKDFTASTLFSKEMDSF